MYVDRRDAIRVTVNINPLRSEFFMGQLIKFGGKDNTDIIVMELLV